MASRAVRSFLTEPRPSLTATAPWRDWLLVALLLVAGLVEVALADGLEWPAVAVLAGVAPAVCLRWRRTDPLLVTGIVFSSTVVGNAVLLLGTGSPMELVTLTYVLLLPYALLRWGSGTEAAVGMTIALAAAVFSTTAAGEFDDLAGLPILALPAALGASMRYRARSRLSETDRIRLHEREQLARELHDTVAHHVSAIAIRAQAGRSLAASNPDAALDALEVIEEAASRTLSDMRSLVGALRDGEAADLTPQRGVRDIERLTDATAGPARIDIRLAGDLDSLNPLVDAAVYRIVQESVTNALRHARNATRIDVEVCADDESVRLTVADDGQAATLAASRAPGFGIIGMTERATLLGGTLHAGPRPDSGWAVTAELSRNGKMQ